MPAPMEGHTMEQPNTQPTLDELHQVVMELRAVLTDTREWLAAVAEDMLDRTEPVNLGERFHQGPQSFTQQMREAVQPRKGAAA